MIFIHKKHCHVPLTSTKLQTMSDIIVKTWQTERKPTGKKLQLIYFTIKSNIHLTVAQISKNPSVNHLGMNNDMYTADCIGRVQPEHMQENAIGHFIVMVSLTSSWPVIVTYAVSVSLTWQGYNTEADSGSVKAIIAPYCYKQPKLINVTNHNSTVIAEHIWKLKQILDRHKKHEWVMWVTKIKHNCSVSEKLCLYPLNSSQDGL